MNVKKILVWDKRQIGWIEYRKKGFFRKRDVICFFSTQSSFWDNEFKSKDRLKLFLEDNHFILEDDMVYERWSVDLIYNYKCSTTIYFNSKTAQNDWLKEHATNFIDNGK